jgi:hypothetical protein
MCAAVSGTIRTRLLTDAPLKGGGLDSESAGNEHDEERVYASST